MTEQTGPNQPPVDNPPPEDKDPESLDRRNFEILRSTYEHYMGNQLIAIGFGHHAISHPYFPRDRHHQRMAQSLSRSSGILYVTHSALSQIQYDDKFKKFSGQFMFDIDSKIREGLKATGTGDVGPKAEPEEEWTADEVVPDRFTIYRNTVDYYIGHALNDPRFHIEALEEELQNKPRIHQLVKKAHIGILSATAIKEVIGGVSPDAGKSAPGTQNPENSDSAWYNLDAQIEARFRRLEQEYLEHRKP